LHNYFSNITQTAPYMKRSVLKNTIFSNYTKAEFLIFMFTFYFYKYNQIKNLATLKAQTNLSESLY